MISVWRKTAARSLSFLVSMAACAAFPAGLYILDDASSLTNAVSNALSGQGLEARRIPLEEINVSPMRSDFAALWVVPNFATVRNNTFELIQRHLADGGSLLCVGDPPFQKVLYPDGNQWVTSSEYLVKSLTPQSILSFEGMKPADARLGTDGPEEKNSIVFEKDKSPGIPSAPKTMAAHCKMPNVHGWATYELPLRKTVPHGDVVTFWAKGTTVTTRLSVEWREKDSSRWIAVVDLKPDWQFYTVTPADFVYWASPGITIPRGGARDSVKFENAASVCIGLAATHTRLGPGPHEFWVADIGIGTMKDKDLLTTINLPPIDGLYPLSMVYPMKPAAATVQESFRWTLGDAKLELPKDAWSSYWRPMGSGLNKGRRVRFIPVVTAQNSEGTRAGTLAAIMHHFESPFPNATYGYISVNDPALIESPGWAGVMAHMIDRMNVRSFLAEAGSAKFTYDVRDLPAGRFQVSARTLSVSPPKETSDKLKLRIEVTDGANMVVQQEKRVSAIGTSGLDVPVPVPDDTSTVLFIRSELYSPAGKLIDLVKQEVRFDGPRKGQKFITARDRSFWKDGQALRPFGVNYMPSSGCALVNKSDFEYWLEDRSYDPEIVEHDLQTIANMGMNSISAFCYLRSLDKGNLLDLLARCRAHGLTVNLSLRPNSNPLPTAPDVLEKMIGKLRLAEKDEILAYDIAWEPWWGGMAKRAKFGPQWKDWVIKKYGSEENAYTLWQYTPKNLEQFPHDDDLRTSGPYIAAVAGYRQFVTEFLTAEYAKSRDAIRAVDPNHLVSFRQSEGGNPLVDPGAYPIELREVADAVDFFSPEAYGVGDKEDSARTLLFTASYAQGLAPGKPIISAEFGKSVWSGNPFLPQQALYEQQAEVFTRIFNYGQQAGYAGFYSWWFPGGYRKYEESDYGIVNPDGTSRPVGKVILQNAAMLKSPPPPITWTPELKSAAGSTNPRGYVGLYDDLGVKFFNVIEPNSLPLIVRLDRH